LTIDLTNSSIHRLPIHQFATENLMAYPIKVCSICSEEFELKPDKPGFANRCPACSAPDSDQSARASDPLKQNSNSEMNAARRQAMRDLLYRKES
jgi:hypothetical protein